jgi:hypothetical protein
MWNDVVVIFGLICVSVYLMIYRIRWYYVSALAPCVCFVRKRLGCGVERTHEEGEGVQWLCRTLP